MDRDEAIRLLNAGSVADWNDRRNQGEIIPDLSDPALSEEKILESATKRTFATVVDGEVRQRSKLDPLQIGFDHPAYAFLTVDYLPGLVGLKGIRVPGIDLRNANLRWADLRNADLSEANLEGADLRRTNFGGANLKRAILSGVDLRGANLAASEETERELTWELVRYKGWTAGADLAGARLKGANFEGAVFGGTNLSFLDLSSCKGLESAVHRGPSSIGFETFILSDGKIPGSFLRGCGVPDPVIDYIPSLLGSMSPIQFYSCFISHSSKDAPFADRLHADLQARGVRCWFAPHDLRIGDRFRHRIDESIRLHEKLLIVLSENSIASQEVESEVEAAIEREKAQGMTILFPIRLDDSVASASGWPSLVRRTRHIGDFTRWKEHDFYSTALDRLMRDLKSEPHPTTTDL